MEKTKVLEVLRNNDSPQKQYNDLLQLFMKHPHHGPSLAKYYNASGFSKANLDTLKYDIKQTYGITDAEVRNFVPEKKAEKVNLEKASEELNNALGEQLLKIDVDQLDYHKELKPLAIALANSRDIELRDMKADTLRDFLNEEKSKLAPVNAEEVSGDETTNSDDAKEAGETEASEKQLPVPGDEAQENKKLREEFPFLNEKDCPDKFKILVADKFSALKAYHDAFEEIQRKKKAGDNEGLFELGKKAVENWELNQLIYDELNYYNEHKELLGNHPIFADDMLQKTVEAYSTQEAMKRQGNLRSYISRDTKKLKGIKDAKKKANAEAKLKVWQDELDLIDARLNADDKK